MPSAASQSLRSVHSVDVLPTVETRWFYQGAIPEPVLDWFRDGARGHEAAPSRVDHYLLVPDTATLGVKLREGRIEVKQRFSEEGAIEFAEHAVGVVERWRKWGFSLADAGDSAAVLAEAGHWHAVTKLRLIRTYAVKPDGAVVLLPGPSLNEPTCSLELTCVAIASQRWWTVGLEAAGAAAASASTLQRIASLALAGLRGFELRADASYGYPEWLRLLLV